MSPFLPREALSPSGLSSLPSSQVSSLSIGGASCVLNPHPALWLQVELSDGTAHTITDAYAGKEYIIQVAAKDNEIGTWSDWSVAAHATPWTEEPRHLTTEAQAPGEPALCPRICALGWPVLWPGSILPPTPPRTGSLCSKGLHALCGCHTPVCPIPVFLVLAILTSLVGIIGWKGHP